MIFPSFGFWFLLPYIRWYWYCIRFYHINPGITWHNMESIWQTYKQVVGVPWDAFPLKMHTHACLCFFWRLFQIVSSTMDLDGSWGQGSSRRDFHFVIFQSPFRMGLLSKVARSTTSGPVLALLDAVVLEKIQLLHLPKQQRICVQWSIDSIVHCQQFDTFGILWHPLP